MENRDDSSAKKTGGETTPGHQPADGGQKPGDTEANYRFGSVRALKAAEILSLIGALYSSIPSGLAGPCGGPCY